MPKKVVCYKAVDFFRFAFNVASDCLSAMFSVSGFFDAGSCYKRPKLVVSLAEISERGRNGEPLGSMLCYKLYAEVDSDIN